MKTINLQLAHWEEFQTLYIFPVVFLPSWTSLLKRQQLTFSTQTSVFLPSCFRLGPSWLESLWVVCWCEILNSGRWLTLLSQHLGSNRYTSFMSYLFLQLNYGNRAIIHKNWLWTQILLLMKILPFNYITLFFCKITKCTLNNWDSLQYFIFWKQWNIANIVMDNIHTQMHMNNTRHHFTIERHNLELYKKKTLCRTEMFAVSSSNYF